MSGFKNDIAVATAFSNTVGIPATDTFAKGTSSGGASNFFYEIDSNNSTGTAGLRIANAGAAAQTWEVAAVGSTNALQMQYQSVALWEMLSTKFMRFYGIASGFTGTHWTSAMAGVQTTDATNTNIAVITLNANELVTCRAVINGFNSTFTAGIGGDLLFTARRAGGGAILVGAAIVRINEDSAGAPTFTGNVAGNNMRLRVTGEAATTYNWTVFYEYMRTQTSA